MSDEVRTALASVVDGRTLSMDEARAAMSEHLELAQRAFASEEEPGSN